MSEPWNCPDCLKPYDGSGRSQCECTLVQILADDVNKLRAQFATKDERGEKLCPHQRPQSDCRDCDRERIAELEEKRLNRRCQFAEAAANEKIAASSGSLGRALANYAATMLRKTVNSYELTLAAFAADYDCDENAHQCVAVPNLLRPVCRKCRAREVLEALRIG